MSSTTVCEPIEQIVVEEKVETSDSEADSAHIVFVPDEMNTTPQALLMRARVEGFPVTALCGYTWIPVRMAKGLPVCSKCLEIYQQDGENRDDRNELPDE